MKTLIISIDGTRRTLSVDNDCTIQHVYHQVQKMASIPDEDAISLLYEGKTLEFKAKQKLSTYGIENMATITVAVRVHGGMFCNIPGFVSRTNTEPCCIYGDNNPNEHRAKMQCGHVFSVEAMRNYCSTTLNDGLYQFYCPQCRAEWSYEHVRHVACFSDAEMGEKGERLNANFLKYGKAMQQCPTCQNYCLRDLNTWVGAVNYVDCRICTSRRGKKTSFCWSCKGKWRGGLGKLCGNKGCDGGDSRIRELAKCDKKQIGEIIGCPTMRGCPRCGALIIHHDQCKHMTCPSCNYSFCFSCLKTPAADGVWMCGLAYSPCPTGIAPRQTTLPG